MWSIIHDVIEDLHASGVPDQDKLNIKRFLMHVAWHEGRFLKTRTQDGGGPGRSFYQFEKLKAKDAVDEAKRREDAATGQKWLTALATRSGESKEDLVKAAAALAQSGPWPDNRSNLIERLLLSNDLFATYMARMALARFEDPVPASSEYEQQAEYWAAKWKVVFNSDAEREAKKKDFVREAKEVDALRGG